MILNQHGIAGLPSGGSPVIPTEYKRVEYVYNTNYATLNIVPNNPSYVMLNQIGTDYRIEFGIKIVSAIDQSGQGILIAYNNNLNFCSFYMNASYDTNVMRVQCQNGGSITARNIPKATDLECVIDKDIFTANGTDITIEYTRVQNYINIIIFAGDFRQKGFKYIKAYSPSNELVIDLEPVVRKADSVPGYYDTVTQQFVTAYDQGLVAGPDVA